MTRNEEDVKFAKEGHVALRDPRWEWFQSLLRIKVFAMVFFEPLAIHTFYHKTDV